MSATRSVTPPRRVRWQVGGRLAWAVLVVLVLGAALAPDPVPLGAARLAAFVTMVAGGSLLVVRAGAVDLATAAMVGAGATVGGVLPALIGVPVVAGSALPVGLPAGAVAGAAVGVLAGVLHGRVGRSLGALASLAITTGGVALLGGLPALGGVAGFHAVALPAAGGARVEAVVVGVVALLALVVAASVQRTRIAAAASVAVRAPVVAAATGRAPARDAAVLGAAAGGLLGVGGVLLASVDGSVIAGAYGLQLAAGIALAAVLGGLAPFGPVVGALLVWGPGTVWPLVPLVGTAPALLVAGPLGLALLALRRGRPLVPTHVGVGPRHGADTEPTRPTEAEPPPTADPGPATDEGPASSRDPAPTPGPDVPPLLGPRPGLRGLRGRGVPTPAGPIDLEVAPGEVLAVVGPNGAGKSTLLARIGGQLPDHDTVRLLATDHEGEPIVLAPGRTARARARAGIRRTWQRPPDLTTDDALTVAGPPTDVAAAVAWWDASATLAAAAPEPASTDDPGVAQVVRLLAGRPAVVLLDEPTAVAPDQLELLLLALRHAGTAVVLVDHRPEVLALADRTVEVGP